MLRTNLCIIWAAAAVLYAAGAAAQHVSSSQCPTMHSMEDFDAREFLGTWYVYQQYKVGAERGMSCKTLTMKEDGSATMEFIAKSRLLTVEGMFLVDANSMGLIKAKFDYGDVLGSDNTGVVVWNILATDYNTYAVLAACQEGDTSSKQYVYVLSRTSTPSSYQVARMEANYRVFDGQWGDGILETQDLGQCEVIDSRVSGLPSISELAQDAEEPTTEGLMLGEEALQELEKLGGSNALIHINIADSSIAVHGNRAPPFKSPSVSGTSTQHSFRSGATAIAAPASTTTAQVSSEVTTPTNSMYEEILLGVNPTSPQQQMDPRVAAFILRLKKPPSFIEWSEITNSPTFRKGAENGTPVDLFINSLRNKPNFVDFAAHSAGLPYRTGIRIFRTKNHK
ncbi:uncharacterized protein LOC108674907 isoform X1 [Hyalella azteca]|uniref:Uncharacterized protein LOC108674907 isoform X1 n=1 Tax=Hyalella azteca TaxID=294128 RepID=A0A8B7NX83_HYAAZ|nr:uncharacterized protein LOC108674907 isoform X1 [Hyalella azteca]